MGLSAVKPGFLRQKRIMSVGEAVWTPEHGPKGLADILSPETVFLRTLCLERKRAERSKKAFALLLLDLGELGRGSDGSALVVKTVSRLLATIRETDFPGWYVDNRVLGVIFAELGAAPKETVLSTLDKKVTSALKDALTEKHLDRVRFALYCFPEDWTEDKTSQGTLSPIYPDLVQWEKSRRIPLVLKRAMDIVGALLGLIVFSPVFAIAAVAIKLTSPGPILFRQERVGQYGRPFVFLKFRSMYVSSDPRIHMDYVKRFIAGKEEPGALGREGQAVYKLTQDSRVTRVGQFLRKTSLDELPQFFNVLRGEMSLVGPRPPLAYELEAYDVWHRRRLLETKPGITGLWQVKGRSRLRFDEMVRLDLRYARTWSIWLDIKILLQTPRAVFSGEGAY